MAIENANDHPFKVAIVKDAEMFANSHPFKVYIEGGSGGGGEARVVDELPQEGETGYIYLVLKEHTASGDIYDEWIWALQQDGETYGWEHIGATNEVTIILYNETGDNTDGAMTQKAVTDALDEKANNSDIPTVVQTTGTSTSDVMSQNATTSMIYADPTTKEKIQIGVNANATGASSVCIGKVATNGFAAYGVSIAERASVSGAFGVAIGYNSSVKDNYGVAIGSYSQATQRGQFDISSSRNGGTTYGYNGSQYRLLTGLYDPQSDHDAATKGYVDAHSFSPTISNNTLYL